MADTAVADAVIGPGSVVEVRTRFDGRWAAGYVAEAVVSAGYVLRRACDGRLVPGVFAPDEVRALAAQSLRLRLPSTA